MTMEDLMKEARAALNDAYQEVLYDETLDEDQRAAVVNSLGTALDEVDEALRFLAYQSEE